MAKGDATRDDEDDSASEKTGTASAELVIVPPLNPTPPPQAPQPAAVPAEGAPGPATAGDDAAHPIGSDARRSKLAAADAISTSAASPEPAASAKSSANAASQGTAASAEIAPPTPSTTLPIHTGATPAPLPSTPALGTSAAAAPASPAAQVAHAVAEPVRVMLASPSTETGQSHVTTIQLDPAELGRVEIRIERTSDGPAKVQLAADRPETLLRLVHDQPQLQQALDQAGIPQEGRTISFSLGTDSGSSGNAFSAFSGGTSNNGGQRAPGNYGFFGGDAEAVTESSAATPLWTRSALDITA